MYEMHLVLSLFLWIVMIVWYLRQPESSMFHPNTYYLAFHGVVFVIRPIFKQVNGYNSLYALYQFMPTETERHLTLISAELGLFFFCTTCHIFGSAFLQFKGRDHGVEQRFGFPLILSLALLTPLLYLSFRYVLSNNFGDEDLLHLSQISATNTVLTDTTGYITDANVMLGSFGVLIAWAYRFRLLSLAPFALFVGLRMAIGRGRWTFIMLSTSLALAYMYDKRKRWFSARALMLALALVPTFYILGTNRSAIADMITGRETSANAEESAEHDMLDNMDFANLEYLEYVIHSVPDLSGTYDYFLKNLEVITAPIPRVLWSGKPVGPPIQLYKLADYGFPIGITWSLVGEGWQDLGLFGVVIWCSFAGALMGYVYNLFARSRQTPAQVMYYVLFIPLCLQWYRDGILLTLLKFPLFVLLPVALGQFLHAVILMLGNRSIARMQRNNSNLPRTTAGEI